LLESVQWIRSWTDGDFEITKEPLSLNLKDLPHALDQHSSSVGKTDYSLLYYCSLAPANSSTLLDIIALVTKRNPKKTAKTKTEYKRIELQNRAKHVTDEEVMVFKIS